MTTIQQGQTLGAYRILEQIGKGGMAVVFKAYQPSMERHVAVKVLPFQFADQETFIQRFQREIRVIASLEHPNILPVYDSGDHEGTPYLVMRYMEGGTLQERLQAGRLSLKQIDHLFTPLAQALHYAHSKGVVHRDIKPSNVLVNERGDVFLTDFGLAKLHSESSKLTLSGTLTGTPAYMSPEQALGKELDGRSDIYSLGIVLYEMITGQVPFSAETPMAVILGHLHTPLPRPTSLDPSIHPEIENVLLRALNKERDERFANMADFTDAWKQALQMAAAAQGSEAYQAAPPIMPAWEGAFSSYPTPARLQPASTPAPAFTPLPYVLAPDGKVLTPPPGYYQEAAVSRRRFPTWLMMAAGSLVGALALLGLAFAISRFLIPGAQPASLPQGDPNIPQINQNAPQTNLGAPRLEGLEMGQRAQINALRMQAYASVLGISVEELNNAEAQGASLEELVEQSGLEMGAFRDNAQAAFETLLQQAVAAGQISPQEAQQALQNEK